MSNVGSLRSLKNGDLRRGDLLIAYNRHSSLQVLKISLAIVDPLLTFEALRSMSVGIQ